MDPHIDPELVINGDTRNVVDPYRNWKVSAIKAELDTSRFGVHVAIENLQHDFNIGSIVRSANAFNVAGVHIVGKRHWNRRGAMATEKYLELYHHPSIKDFADWAEKAGLPLIGIDNTPGYVPVDTHTFPQKCILVFGQEGPGLSPEMQALCKKTVGIRQYGSTRSVNVGVAAGIVLYEYVRQQSK